MGTWNKSIYWCMRLHKKEPATTSGCMINQPLQGGWNQHSQSIIMHVGPADRILGLLKPGLADLKGTGHLAPDHQMCVRTYNAFGNRNPFPTGNFAPARHMSASMFQPEP